MRIKKKPRNMLIALVLMTMCLTACASGERLSVERVEINPSQDFLYHLANEYHTGVYGEYTREVIKDWIAQNKPILAK